MFTNTQVGQLLPSTTFTVTATNSAGSSVSRVVLSVAGVAPTISYTPSAVHTALATQGSSVTLTPTLFNGGLNLSSCTISPALPAGLSINNSTCVISGTPSVRSPSASYTVTATNTVGSATASFNFFVCPTNFVAVAANSSFYTSPFCVAKYEMKCTGTDCATVVPARTGPTVNTVAASQATGTLWNGMIFPHSKTACENLNGGATPTRFTIITNPQWMNIAREIELNHQNWSSGIRWTGMMNTGHSDGNPASYLAAGADSDPYSGTNNSDLDNLNAGWEQKRTHILSSGKIVWDFGGNLQEWVDWTVPRAERAYRYSDGGVIFRDPITNLIVELNFTDLDTNISSGAMAMSQWFPAGGSMLISDGYGGYVGGRTTDTIDPIIRRGWGGIYGTTALYDDSDPSVGFRCVYLP